MLNRMITNNCLRLNKGPLTLMKGFTKVSTRTFAKTKISYDVKITPPKPPEEDLTVNFGHINKPADEGGKYISDKIPPNALLSVLGYKVSRHPVSSYYTMKVKDLTYHVYNAARMSMGRIAADAAFIIQGKHTPLYKPNKVDCKDKIIIVNGKHAKLTGKKLITKLYRHHTTYPGNLQEISAKDYMQWNPTEMFKRTIKGMLPKNSNREEWLKHIIVYDEAGHDLYHLGLPQFGKVEKINYNELLGGNISPETHEIAYSSVPKEQIPADFKDYQLRDVSKDNNEKSLTHVSNAGMRQKLSETVERHEIKWNRRIRNMGYRYI